MSGHTRRSMLAGVAAGVAASGCLESDDSNGGPGPGEDSTPTGDATPDGTPTPRELGASVDLDGTTVAVTDAAATRQILTLTGGGTDVVAGEDRQYLVATVEGNGASSAVPVPEHLRVRVDGDRYEPADHTLAPGDAGVRVAVGLPLSVAAEDAAVQWVRDGEAVATWRVPAAQQSVLASPPEFQDVDFEFPAEVTSGGLPTFDVQVHNAGGPGPFRAVVTTSTGAETVVRLSLDGGTLAGHTAHVEIDADPGTTGTATLDWGFDEVERSFSVVDG